MSIDVDRPGCSRVSEGDPLEAFSWPRILRLWALATVPMVVLTWLVAPWLIAHTGQPASLVFFFASSLGMAGQGALAWAVLRRERPSWTAAALRRRLWLVTPRRPGIRRASRKPWLWLVPLLGIATVSLFASHAAVALTMAFRFLREPALSRFFPSHAKTLGLMSPELAGQWWLLVVVPVVGLLAAIAGEELFFRGLLLPRMPGRASGLTNALLSSFHYVYVPWMIPGRLLATLGAAWAARRYRSNWIAMLVRVPEGVGLAVLTLAGVTSFTFPPITGPLRTPHVVRGPTPPPVAVRPLASLPACKPENPIMSVDLRGRDVSGLDLRERSRDLDCAAFDSETAWPRSDRLPQAFAPGRILARSRNPGLGLRDLHARGITGRGVGLGRPPLAEPDSFDAYVSSWMWRDDRFGSLSRTRLFSIPIDNRTLASEASPHTMVYFPMGGFSWGPPFIAGTYALAAQVDPSITPERFFDLAMRHARRQPQARADRRMASVILDPAALITALRRK